MKRKCAQCKEAIEIDNNNIVDVICYEKSYYHKHCFCALAEKRSQSKRGKPEKWQAALDNISQIESETVQTLRSLCAKDELNAWLLDNYDITAVPARFWQIVADLEQGVYKGKKCRSISVGMLMDMWKWGQKRLNKIDAKNKTNNIGPQNDTDRLRYDLAILIGHVGDYIKYTTRTKEESAEIKSRVKNAGKLNCEKICVQTKQVQNDEDILSLMDDIF